MAQQTIIERKPIYCRNNCGIEICFDSRKSKSGKSIPIDKSSGLPHQCPNSSYAQQHRGEQQQQEPKLNRESEGVTKSREDDTVFDLLMEINKKLDNVLNHFEALK